MHLYLMPIMGFQHGAIAIQRSLLTILGEDPVAAGLLQTAAQHSLLASRRAGRAALTALTALVRGCTWRCWLLVGSAGLSLSALRILALIGATRTASTGLRQGHSTGQHKCH